MYGKNLPRQGRRRPIRASTLNAAAQTGEDLSRLRMGGNQWTIGGIPLGLPGVTASALALVRTTSTIPGRSGTAPGTTTDDNAVFVNLLDDVLTEDAPLKLYNLTAGALGDGKYGLAFLASGVWWGLVEC